MNSRHNSLSGRGIRTRKVGLMSRLRDLQRYDEDDLGSNREVNLSWQGRSSFERFLSGPVTHYHISQVTKEYQIHSGEMFSIAPAYLQAKFLSTTDPVRYLKIWLRVQIVARWLEVLLKGLLNCQKTSSRIRWPRICLEIQNRLLSEKPPALNQHGYLLRLLLCFHTFKPFPLVPNGPDMPSPHQWCDRCLHSLHWSFQNLRSSFCLPPWTQVMPCLLPTEEEEFIGKQIFSLPLRRRKYRWEMGDTDPFDSTSRISRGEDAQWDSNYEVCTYLLFLSCRATELTR